MRSGPSRSRREHVAPLPQRVDGAGQASPGGRRGVDGVHDLAEALDEPADHEGRRAR